MNVIFGDNVNEIRKSHTVIELDTIIYPGTDAPITAYGVIGPDDFNVMTLPTLESKIKLHEALLKNYKEQNWNFCTDAIIELKGTWPKLVDEFYDNILVRVENYKITPPDDDWTAVLTVDTVA